MEEFQWICYNYILGLPLETTHRWAEPNGSTFSMPEAIQGDYLAKEGIPAHCTVWQENGKLVGIYGETEVEFRYWRKDRVCGLQPKGSGKAVQHNGILYSQWTGMGGTVLYENLSED